MRPYLDLLQRVLHTGEKRTDRTGTGTLSAFAPEPIRVSCQKTLPILTSKRVNFRGVLVELLWFLTGSDNVKFLVENNVNIWNEWAREDGSVGPMYGYQLRGSEDTTIEIDQISELIHNIRTNPYSRRHVMTTWSVPCLEYMVLHPCHGVAIQFYVRNDGRLDCHMYQRSADIFLGLPWNITSYSVLTMLIAQQCELLPGDLTVSLGDAHLYLNHIEQAKEQLGRSRLHSKAQGVLHIEKQSCIDNYKLEHFNLIGYAPHSYIKAPISV